MYRILKNTERFPIRYFYVYLHAEAHTRYLGQNDRIMIVFQTCIMQFWRSCIEIEFYTCMEVWSLKVNGAPRGRGVAIFLQYSRYDPMVFIEAICMRSAEWRTVPGDWTSRDQFKNPGSLFCERRRRCRRGQNYHREKVASLTFRLRGNSSSSLAMRCDARDAVGFSTRTSTSHMEKIRFKWWKDSGTFALHEFAINENLSLGISNRNAILIHEKCAYLFSIPINS